MEFVAAGEIVELLRDHRIESVSEGEDAIFLRMQDGDEVTRLHVRCSASQTEPHADAKVVDAEPEKLASIIEQILHSLHVSEVLLVPVGKWRRVFDAVAFSLASNEDWQEVDAAASVELNTRDPLLCEPSDFHTLTALIGALYSDAEEPDQGFAILTPSTPMLLQVVPDGGTIQITLGNQVVGDEVASCLAS